MTLTADIYELRGTRDLHLRHETLDPDTLGANEVVARTLVSAISPGTEIAAFVGLPPLRPMKVYPRVTGYCNIAEVLAVDTGVSDVKPGDRIATFQSHRSAFICPRDDVMGILPPDADIEACALAYMFHLGYVATLRAGLNPDDKVAVIGMGTVGLGTVAVCATAGAQVHAISDIAMVPAQAMGAHATMTKATALDSDAADADLVITTSNHWEDWELALSLARSEGSIAVMGFPGRGENAPAFNPLDSRWVYDKQLTIVGCGMNPAGSPLKESYPYILSKVADGTLPARKMIGDIVNWQNLAQVYERLAARETGLITCVLDWR